MLAASTNPLVAPVVSNSMRVFSAPAFRISARAASRSAVRCGRLSA